jgi:hypothetical protein
MTERKQPGNSWNTKLNRIKEVESKRNLNLFNLTETE